jgi:hypothetical protein
VLEKLLDRFNGRVQVDVCRGLPVAYGTGKCLSNDFADTGLFSELLSIEPNQRVSDVFEMRCSR